MCASVRLVIIGLNNDLVPVRRQTIIWTNADELSIEILGNKLQWNLYKKSCKKTQ